MLERRIFYIDVGQLSPNKVQAYMERIKSQLNDEANVDNFWIPIRGNNTRLEVFTRESDKDNWERLNPHVINLLETCKIQELESKLSLANKEIERLSRKWWVFWK